MSALAIPWRFLVLSVLVALGGFITYDVNTHGSLKSSDTGKFLKNAGMLEVTEQAVSHSIFYYNKAYSWSAENVPYYTDKVVVFTSPYLSTVSAVCYEYSIIVWDYTEPVREYLSTNVPLWLEWLNSNVPIFFTNTLQTTRYYGEKALWAVADYAVLVWTYIMNLLQMAGTWLQKNVFAGQFSTDKIQEATWKAYDTVHHYSVAAYDWVHQQFKGEQASAWGE